MEDPFGDFVTVQQEPKNEVQVIADFVKNDVESSLFQNFALYEVMDHKEVTESDRNYFKIKVKTGDNSFIHLKVLKPKTDADGVVQFIEVEEKTDTDEL